MNERDAFEKAVLALRRIVVVSVDNADDDPVAGLAQAEEIARDTLEDLAASHFIDETSP